MAIQTIRIGSAEDIFAYDDADFDSGIETSAPIKAGTPVDPEDVLRLDDYPGLAIDTINDIVCVNNEVVCVNNNVVVI